MGPFGAHSRATEPEPCPALRVLVNRLPGESVLPQWGDTTSGRQEHRLLCAQSNRYFRNVFPTQDTSGIFSEAGPTSGSVITVDKPIPPQPSGAFAATPVLWEGDTEDAITSLLGTDAYEQILAEDARQAF